ncbi:helix-turn-helix domain-containing protein, partial [Pseudomonas luteola]
MLRATKVRIYPTLEQAEFLNRQFGAVRFCYN